MPTHRGWTVGLGGIIAIFLGRLLGLTELFILAVATEVLVVLSALFVRLYGFEIEARRVLQPDRAHIGTTCRVELRVRNVSGHRSPVLHARDAVDGNTEAATFLLERLEPGGEAVASYRVPARQRGVHMVGPLSVELRAPLGLASTSVGCAGSDRLVVYPNLIEVSALPGALGGDPDSAVDPPSYLGRLGENYCTLRPYEEGDDLRRVHWASTARTGQLMIRQEEMSWDGRTNLLVDLRRPVHSRTTLEEAITAAASIAAASLRGHNSARLVTTDGRDSGFGVSNSHQTVILEMLAQARWSSTGSLVTALSKIQSLGGSGAVVVVTTNAAPAVDLERVARLSDRFPVLVVVIFERRPGLSAGRSGLPPHITTIRVPMGEPLNGPWHATVSRPRGAPA